MATVKAHIRQLGEIGRQLEQAPNEQVSLTDPDARSMNSAGKGTGIVGYNVQTAVDTKSHMIVAHEVTNVGHDHTALTQMAHLASQAMSQPRLTVLADRGHYGSEEIRRCEQAGFTPSRSLPTAGPTIGSRSATLSTMPSVMGTAVLPESVRSGGVRRSKGA